MRTVTGQEAEQAAGVLVSTTNGSSEEWIEHCVQRYTPEMIAEDAREGWGGLEAPLLYWDLARYYECKAHLKEDDDYCSGLAVFNLNCEEDSPEAFCKSMYEFHSFLKLILDDQPGNDERALAYCRQYYSGSMLQRRGWSEAEGYEDRVCNALARAYRSGYTSICTRLSFDLFPDCSTAANDYHFICRTALYPDEKSCYELKSDEGREGCLTAVTLLKALRGRDPALCGTDLNCSAVVNPSSEVCARMAQSLVQKYCRSKEERSSRK